MEGKRILLASEFSRGDATLARLLPLATALAASGHHITLAAPPAHAAAVTAAGLTFADAPRWTVPPPPGYAAVSYADLLLHHGYAAPDSLRTLLAGWQSVLAQAEPDLLVADFAPTAMLAARIAGAPTAAIGDGFSLPPLTTPLPPMRPWAALPQDAAASVEGRVLAVINARLLAAQVPFLRHLRDLFHAVPSYLCTVPELDHYPNRTGADFYGEVFPATATPTPSWPAAAGERIYLDLHAGHPALPALIAVLDRLRLPTLVQATGWPARQADALERATIQVAPTADRPALLAGCDIAIAQGHEVAVPALLAGKPLLLLPVFVEQMMTLHRLATQGLGHGIAANADTATIDAALRRLVDDRACRLRAANFARAYHGYRPAIAIEAIAEAIEDHLAP
ncbi:MAG TPA: hypothetical protein VFG12_14565 [Rhodopila sp.]|nr:hypothetical protein [Rhodopila sp.]